MNRITIAVLGVFAFLLLAVTADPVFADCGCGGGGRRGPPTRSTVSGLGVGLAGIGLAWGFMWIGLRLVGRVTRK
jgi:hypothetical protein